MANTKKYITTFSKGRIVISTEDLETVSKLIDKLQVPTFLGDGEDCFDIRRIEKLSVIIEIEGDVQKVKLNNAR